MRAARLAAPAKINWTLEVLHRRADGYHEIRSVMQTIDLCDTVTVSESTGIELELSGDAGELADMPHEQNLAWRAADVLRQRYCPDAGARIALEKRVPVAAGLGGGSSDAAAVLRGCRALWGLDTGDDALAAIAAEIGSDVPFFVTGGTAEVRGRGEVVVRLPDSRAPTLMLATPPRGRRHEKTAAMFQALTPAHYSDGYVTVGLTDAIEAGGEVRDALLNNAFEHVTLDLQPETERAMDALRQAGVTPRLAGSGPSFFVLLDAPVDGSALSERIRMLGFEPRIVATLPRDRAMHIEEA